MTTNTTLLRGNCLAPFLDASLFPDEGGFTGGRFCASIPGLPGNPTCCLPCPAAEWAYSDNFKTYSTAAQWLNVVGLVFMLFMIISYIVLPAQQTRSHYLSVCLIVSVTMIALGFTIPLVAQPEQCFNEITPNDMYSSLECAWSGAFIMAGGLAVTTWVFIRALSMNLQICWDIVPARKFFYISQALGWGISAALFTATITATGVSFRFGNACHVNHDNSMADFWGPLMAIGAGAGILQLITFGYCIRVYLKNLWSDEVAATSTNASGSGLPSYSGSERTQTARAVYSRLKKVLWLQWRGIFIVTIILVDVVFFSIVFVYLDHLQASIGSNMSRIEPWLACLITNPTDKNQCVNLVSHWLISEPMVVSVLVMLGLAGIETFIFVTRPTIFSAWIELIRNKFFHRQEFVSLDAKGPRVMRSNSSQGQVKYEPSNLNDKAAYEMQRPGVQRLSLNTDDKTLSPTATVWSSPEDVYKSPYQGHDSPYEYSQRFTLRHGILPAHSPHSLNSASPSTSNYNGNSFARQQTDHFTQNDYAYPPSTQLRSPSSLSHDVHAREEPSFQTNSTAHLRSESDERRYRTPAASFSVPIPPSSHSSLRSVTFDPRDVYIRGGLALNPPSEISETNETAPNIRRNHGTSWDNF
ncbi:Hypothetical protein R9X50_00455400 [Acrodontium crateriforme]|uniref:G-protein coupled receptors family 2 profile 2 domain-containing protein n=1 Tax=Acrodontium crateriforme TaxID=150365 RepID=A0AAQ3M6B1_9PEZI|nr:Hypothetical protein R9X50_00455400 [Acrodontium crateriforme]